MEPFCRFCLPDNGGVLCVFEVRKMNKKQTFVQLLRYFGHFRTFPPIKPNGWQYAEAGISKLQLVKPVQFLIYV